MSNYIFTEMKISKKYKMDSNSFSKKKNSCSTTICKGTNKNNTPCKYKATHTIFCTRHSYLALEHIIKIQKWWKNTYSILNVIRRGIGYNNLEICNNHEDFFTLQNVSEIPSQYLITYLENSTKKVWAFDLRSLYNLIENSKYNTSLLNPYTTIPFSQIFLKYVNYFIQTYKNKTDFKIVDQEQETLSREDQISRNCIDCFIQINSMGYHCNHRWLFDLSKHRLIRLFYEFKDIITYRASLSRNQIIGIFGNPIPFSELIFGIEYKTTLELIELLCNKIKMILQTNSEYKELGILLFLTSLTTVSSEASQSLNYLQQSNFY